MTSGHDHASQAIFPLQRWSRGAGRQSPRPEVTLGRGLREQRVPRDTVTVGTVILPDKARDNKMARMAKVWTHQVSLLHTQKPVYQTIIPRIQRQTRTGEACSSNCPFQVRNPALSSMTVEPGCLLGTGATDTTWSSGTTDYLPVVIPEDWAGVCGCPGVLPEAIYLCLAEERSHRLLDCCFFMPIICGEFLPAGECECDQGVGDQDI